MGGRGQGLFGFVVEGRRSRGGPGGRVVWNLWICFEHRTEGNGEMGGEKASSLKKGELCLGVLGTPIINLKAL